MPEPAVPGLATARLPESHAQGGKDPDYFPADGRTTDGAPALPGVRGKEVIRFGLIAVQRHRAIVPSFQNPMVYDHLRSRGYAVPQFRIRTRQQVEYRAPMDGSQRVLK